MKYFILFIILSLIGCSTNKSSESKAVENKSDVSVAEQKNSEKNCDKCLQTEYADQKPDTAFVFSNGKKLNICGFVETQEGRRIFSEFVIYVCGQNSIVNFFGAVENYEIEFLNDTLKLKNLKVLALSENRELITQNWATEYLYFSGKDLMSFIRINPKVKYNDEQIKRTLAEFEQTKWQTQNSAISEEYSEEKMLLANKLMIAAISGSDKAEKYFNDFESKFEPDGAHAEWYDEMDSMLILAKKLKN